VQAEELAELERLSEQATIGPWIARTDMDEGWLVCSLGNSSEDGNDWHVMTTPMSCSELNGDAKTDAAFIAAAREAVPRLIAEVRKMTALYEAQRNTTNAVDLVLIEVRKELGNLRHSIKHVLDTQAEFDEPLSFEWDAPELAHEVGRSIWHLSQRIQSLNAEKNGAYSERNRCVAALAWAAVRLGWRVWLAQHPDDPNWDKEWLTIVFIETPAGQVSWHIHDSERKLFMGVTNSGGAPWDGHTTAEKYDRLASLGVP
jgi:hypothetical protein